nr:hypothetical protein CFP56_22473 [Quercus suber]
MSLEGHFVGQATSIDLISHRPRVGMTSHLLHTDSDAAIDITVQDAGRQDEVSLVSRPAGRTGCEPSG